MSQQSRIAIKVSKHFAFRCSSHCVPATVCESAPVRGAQSAPNWFGQHVPLKEAGGKMLTGAPGPWANPPEVRASKELTLQRYTNQTHRKESLLCPQNSTFFDGKGLPPGAAAATGSHPSLGQIGTCSGALPRGGGEGDIEDGGVPHPGSLLSQGPVQCWPP